MIDRLTRLTHCGDYGSAKDWENDFAEKCALRNALGPYEDLGFKPDELMPKESYAAMDKLAILQWQLKED